MEIDENNSKPEEKSENAAIKSIEQMKDIPKESKQ